MSDCRLAEGDDRVGGGHQDLAHEHVLCRSWIFSSSAAVEAEERERTRRSIQDWIFIFFLTSFGLRRRILKSKIPPELFGRPFTCRNLVKEIVLMRHAIKDGEVGGQR